ncbi:hypothetical protein V6N13_127941 [Hibiscus sabdariffa]
MENSSKRASFYLGNLLALLLPCLFFFIQNLVVPVTGDVNVTPYIPIENITIDCGSSTDGRSMDGRAWVGDVDGQFSRIEQNKSSAFALQLQELVEEKLTPNAGAGIEEDVDDETPFRAYAMEDDSGEVFSSIGDHVMNSRSISTFSLTTSDEQSFITSDSDKHSSKAVFSQIRDPQGR